MRTAQECIDQAQNKIEIASGKEARAPEIAQSLYTGAQTLIDLARYLREEVMYHPRIGLETIGAPDSIQAAPKT